MRLNNWLLSWIIGLVAASPSAQPNPNGLGTNTNLPIVDLGYVQQQATSFNQTGNFFRFNNIAYAEPPLGDLRFAAPVPPKTIHGIQNGGNTLPQCPQSTPDWLIQALTAGFVEHLDQDYSNSETEDCLYLDVLVPKSIFNHRQYSTGAPVMVWVYGGGLVLGSKSDDLNAPGLVARGMETTGTDGVIYVAFNYRVGNFGTLGGPLFRSQGGDANIALLDQRMALQWVRQNIAKFGGDPSRITVFGESGGANSIIHQITATTPWGSVQSPLFQQAIIQSPAEALIVPDATADVQFEKFLNRLGVKTLADARKLSTVVLQAANYDLIQAFPTGVFPYATTRDNIFGRETARKALLEGHFGDHLKIVASYNLNEGFIFVPPGITNDDFRSYAQGWLPGLDSSQLDTLADTLYPAGAYTSAESRTSAFIGELLINCNFEAVQRGFKSQGYAYQFSVSPVSPLPAGYHTQDISFTYFNGQDPVQGPSNDTVAQDLQTYLVNFAATGSPNAFPASIKLPAMPIYGRQGHLLNLTDTGYPVVTDALTLPDTQKRCAFFNGL